MTGALILAAAMAMGGPVCRADGACLGSPPTVAVPLEGRASARPRTGPAEAGPSIYVPPEVQSSASRDRFDAGGEMSVLFDWLPERDVFELRPRLLADARFEPADWLRFYGEALAEGLAADRSEFGGVGYAVAWLREGWVELVGNRADLRAGYGRIVWGRLDEVQPSDVINPLDAAKYLLEDRSEARLPVAFVRGRVYPVDGVAIEGIISPRFERGVYDTLDEPTSPFNLLNDLVLPAGTVVSTNEVEGRPPDVSWSKPLGGARVTATAGRLDFAVSAYEGADGFGIVTFEPETVPPVSAQVVGRLVETFPRFRMYAGDFETVMGEWALRGEAAVFTKKKLAGVTVPGAVNGRVIDAGVGFDRRAGDLRVYGTALFHREWSDEDPGVERTDFSLVGSVDTTLARDTHLLRAFAVVNPGDESAFVRGLWEWSIADNTSLDVSAGAFLGTSNDTLGRFKGRNFVFTRLRWHF